MLFDLNQNNLFLSLQKLEQFLKGILLRNEEENQLSLFFLLINSKTDFAEEIDIISSVSSSMLN